MIKVLRIGIAIIVLFVSITILAATNDGPWQKLLEKDTNHACTLAGYGTENFAITVGYAGEVHYTTNKGETWPRASSFSACRFGLEIVNDKIAWHCGNQGNVRVTVDGGVVWNSAANFGSNEPDHCRFLSFINEKIGWIASPYELAATSDGGKTWNTLTLPEGCMDISAIDIRSEKDGYVLDMKGKIFITSDGGKTWSERSLGLDKGTTLMLFYTPSAAMRFITADKGIVVLCQKGQGVFARVTTDGGKTWKNENISKSIGGLYLSKNGQLLTITSRASGNGRFAKVTVLKRKTGF